MLRIAAFPTNPATYRHFQRLRDLHPDCSDAEILRRLILPEHPPAGQGRRWIRDHRVLGIALSEPEWQALHAHRRSGESVTACLNRLIQTHAQEQEQS